MPENKLVIFPKTTTHPKRKSLLKFSRSTTPKPQAGIQTLLLTQNYHFFKKRVLLPGRVLLCPIVSTSGLVCHWKTWITRQAALVGTSRPSTMSLQQFSGLEQGPQNTKWPFKWDLICHLGFGINGTSLPRTAALPVRWRVLL